MKKLFLLIVLVSVFGFSQKDCKFKINKIDDFTKEKYILTDNKVASFDMQENQILFYFLSNKENYLGVKISFSGHHSIIINQNQSISLLFDNGNVIDLKNTNIEAGKLKGNGGLLSSTDFDILFVLNEDLVNSLKTKIVKIRVNTTDGFKDFDVKEKRYNKILETLNCFLLEIK